MRGAAAGARRVTAWVACLNKLAGSASSKFADVSRSLCGAAKTAARLLPLRNAGARFADVAPPTFRGATFISAPGHLRAGASPKDTKQECDWAKVARIRAPPKFALLGRSRSAALAFVRRSFAVRSPFVRSLVRSPLAHLVEARVYRNSRAGAHGINGRLGRFMMTMHID